MDKFMPPTRDQFEKRYGDTILGDYANDGTSNFISNANGMASKWLLETAASIKNAHPPI